MVDHHVHFTDYALGLTRVQLEGARSLEEAVARVAARVQRAKPGEWILGMGWNHREWERPEFPGKEPLDRIAPANPVALERKDMHSIWLNSAARRAANITRETRDPDGGVVVRDANGEPTGLLREQAVRLAQDAIGPAHGFFLEAIARLRRSTHWRAYTRRSRANARAASRAAAGILQSGSLLKRRYAPMPTH